MGPAREPYLESAVEGVACILGMTGFGSIPVAAGGGFEEWPPMLPLDGGKYSVSSTAAAIEYGYAEEGGHLLGLSQIDAEDPCHNSVAFEVVL